jgi:hypothetical protein
MVPGSRAVPARIVALSLASLAVPLVTALAAPQWLAEEEGLLVWLWAFAPAIAIPQAQSSLPGGCSGN